jgi:biotin synthase
MQIITDLKNKVCDGYKINYEEALILSKTNPKEELYDAANFIREYFCGNTMDLCSITNARSGKCAEDCKWCSQSKFHNTDIEIYELVDKETAVSQAKSNREKGIDRYSLVTSGRTVSDKTLKDLIEIYEEIKQTCDIKLCASMGLLPKDKLKKLKDSGIIRYHCNLETAPSFFDKLCTTHTIGEKIQTIKWSQEIGLEVCSGGIIGMGETEGQRIELAITLRELNIKSIPINILNPIEGTALENVSPLSEDEILTTIALFRFINPKANLRFAGGRMLIKSFQDKALHSGINASIVGDLLTTIGSSVEEDLADFKNSGFIFKNKN